MPPPIILYAIPAFLALLVLEAIADSVMRLDLYERRDPLASLSMGIRNVVVNLFAKAVIFPFFLFLYRFAIFHIGFAWWAWVVGFVADEFSYYWFHRCSHECRLF